MTARWIALIAALIATGCSLSVAEEPAPLPAVYAIELADGTQCVAIERSADDVDLVCDFQRRESTSAVDSLL
ncbi:hypothetical protein [Hydrocarboniphaga sp.]|uniref:hypothetical protein n=1 Tax=Hydrocarboniphaga sp. TaxID=2033016 RepID=UPI003D144FDA